MWANAQRDGRPAEYRWRPLLNAAKFGQTNETISAASGPKFPNFGVARNHVWNEIKLF